jgi:hypothetical protein
MKNAFVSDVPLEEVFKEALERQLWGEWVIVFCGHSKIANPTPEEWKLLEANWYEGCAPVDSVNDLIKLRK